VTVAIHAARRVSPIDWEGVPQSYAGKCSAVCRTAQECEDLVLWFGSADFCPNLPVLVMVPGADAPVAIAGMGFATAAELKDCAVVTWHDKSQKIASKGTMFDFDALRERRGLMRREEVDAATREAMLSRIAKHKANPISDPSRQPQFPNAKNKTQFVIGKKVNDAQSMD